MCLFASQKALGVVFMVKMILKTGLLNPKGHLGSLFKGDRPFLGHPHRRLPENTIFMVQIKERLQSVFEQQKRSFDLL